MNKPEKELYVRDLPQGLSATRRLLAYLLRATKLRVQMSRMGKERFWRLPKELSDALVPFVLSERTTLGFYRAVCTRLGVDPSGGDGEWGAIEVWLPEGRVRWDHAVAALQFPDVRTIVQESPDFLSTFACCKSNAEEDHLFQQFTDPVVPTLYLPELPSSPISPSTFRSVWTLVTPLHHGSDEKHGNVSLFRRQTVLDPVSGRSAYVPFISGNAIRGTWRDLVMERWLHLIGLSTKDLHPGRAHALLAGGSVESGADTSKVDNVVRSEARHKCPPWDLLAGCIDQQVMGGSVNVGDAILVCKENAWLVHGELAPDQELEPFCNSLPSAIETTQIRLGTRQAHKDLGEGDGVQMLWDTESLIPGHQMIHSFSLRGKNELAASCLVDLLNLFKESAHVGAGSARGYGKISFTSYTSPSETLPSSDVYLSYVKDHLEEMREWACRPPRAKTEKKKRAVG